MQKEQNKDKNQPGLKDQGQAMPEKKAETAGHQTTPASKDFGPIQEPKQLLPLKKDSNTFKVIIGLLIGIVVIFILFLVVAGIGVYKYNWDNQFVNWLPFPAALMEGKILRYSDYQDDLATLDHFYTVQVEQSGSAVQKPSDDYLEKSVLSRMVREKFLAEAAASFGLTVSQQEVDDEFAALAAQAESAEQVSEQLLNLYNWTTDQFKEKVIKPYLIRLKIQQYLAEDDSINTEAKDKAEEVLSKLKAEEQTFEELAAEYSEDVTASAGGDLGYFSLGQMVTEFEEAAFALEPGEISEVVKTQYGYHIIKLIEKIPASEDTPEQLHTAHILIKVKDVDEWTDEELAIKSVVVFVSGYEWKKDCGLVLAKEETCENNTLLDFLTNSQGSVGDTNSANQAE